MTALTQQRPQSADASARRPALETALSESGEQPQHEAAHDATHERFKHDVLEGLALPQKALPAQYLYDAAGSALFEAITRLPSYYPTRTEITLLKDRAAGLSDRVEAGTALVEFGSGSSVKTEVLLQALAQIKHYVPIDVSPAALDEAVTRLITRFPQVAVMPLVGDFASKPAWPHYIEDAPKIGFFPGSTIGNMEPEAARALLARFASWLGAGSRLVIGADLQKDEAMLHAAYDDDQGVTAKFNLNLLTRMNRELDATFALEDFAHVVRYDRERHRIEMHLEAQRAHTVEVAGHRFSFTQGETIHTENSHKYTVEQFTRTSRAAGWQVEETWVDEAQLFSVHVLIASGPSL
ncbi:MAG: L-histidine N(alpha)-methyltransferase [Pseudomonadota bacterium]